MPVTNRGTFLIGFSPNAMFSSDFALFFILFPICFLESSSKIAQSRAWPKTREIGLGTRDTMLGQTTFKIKSSVISYPVLLCISPHHIYSMY